MQLGSCVAVAVVVAGSYSSSWTPSLGTSMYLNVALKKTKRPKKERKLYLVAFPLWCNQLGGVLGVLR